MNAENEILTEWLNAECGYFVRGTRCLEKFRSLHQEVEVWETAQYGKLFRLDGSFMTSEADEFFYHENLVHVAAITHPNVETALIIGGGDGGSAEELLKHPKVERVTIVELDQAVVDIARKYLQAVNRGALDNERVTLKIGDGLAYVRETTECFDMIVLDLTDPGGPSQPLYTADFYHACAARLNPGGLLSLHIASPVAQPERCRQCVADLRAAFAIVRPYLVAIPLYGGLWAMACASTSLDPTRLLAADVERRLELRRILDLKYYNGGTHRGMLALPNFVRTLLND
jgi:spermidine synthase